MRENPDGGRGSGTALSRGTDAAQLMTAAASALVFLVAMNLRAPLTSVGPLLPRIGGALMLGESVQGLLGSLPLLAFAAISPVVHRVSARLGANRTVLAALVCLAVGVVLRSYGGVVGLWAGTLVIGSAIAVGNVLVPVIVKRDYRDSASLATGLYSACMTGMASLASAITVPLADMIGWRGMLAVWAMPAVLVAVVWGARIVFTTPDRVAAISEPNSADAVLPHPARLAPRQQDDAPPQPSVWRSREAWLLTAFMGLQSTNYYIMVNWLPTIEASFGVPAQDTGWHLALFQLIGIIAGLGIPALLHGDSQVAATLTASLPLAFSAIGWLLAPGLDLVWVAVASVGSGCSLVVALSLIGIKGGSSGARTAQLSGMAQSLGYLLAAVGPLAAGSLFELTGGWQATLAALVGLATLQAVVGVLVGRAKR